jgi:hypothetical protein
MAEVSQKLDREGGRIAACFTKMAEPELSPVDSALRQCKTLKALRYKVRCRYGCPEADKSKWKYRFKAVWLCNEV